MEFCLREALLFSILLHLTIADRRLLFVQTVFRHGARAPIEKPTTPEAMEYYYRGKGEMTDRGMEEARMLGRVLREKYVNSGFIDGRYNPKEVSFLSSPVPRCLMTSQLMGSAMFNKTSNGESIAVPVIMKPKQLDYTLHPKFTCFYQWEYTRKELSADIQNMNFTAVFSALVDRHSSIKELKEHAESIESYYVENMDNLPLPSWYNETVKQEVKKIIFLYLSHINGAGLYHNPEIMKTKSGLLLLTLQNKMKQAWRCATNQSSTEECAHQTKMIAYGTHDATLMSLADSLDVLEAATGESTPPEYAAAFVFELWNIDGKPAVKTLFHRSITDKTFIDLSHLVRGCEGGKDYCELENFVNCCDDYITENPSEICHPKAREWELSVVAWVFLCMSVCLTCLLFCTLHMILKLRKRTSVTKT